jgi:hypothetical protein
MRALILVAALVAAGPASAVELVYKSDELNVHLLESSCKSERIKFMAASVGVEVPYAGMARKGNYVVGLCWGKVDDKFVIIDEDGMGGFMGVDLFSVNHGV